ncbi:hypothetical protein EDD85DRAFT_772858 [Armillaria nabsnona]|nr:hypothetical protein EDD85DRAFT_772858 [Armillaria nabsnona]
MISILPPDPGHVHVPFPTYTIIIEQWYVFVPLLVQTYTDALQGGGGRYPYPKYVWSPAGGWWVQPSNWKANTAVVATGIFAIAYLVGSLSAAREQRPIAPKKWIPSMLWAKQYQDAEKVRYRNNSLSKAHLCSGIIVEDSLIFSLLNTLPEASRNRELNQIMHLYM